MEWPTTLIVPVALAVVVLAAFLPYAGVSTYFATLPLAFLSVVGLAILWFQLRRASERNRAAEGSESR